MNIIDIGILIDINKLLDTRLLIQAGSGGGKSYALRKVIESIGNQVQQIIIDPEGEFVTLREKFPFALVSKQGDIPLSLKYAETLAHKLLETNLSAIIDLYELPQQERILFVKRFISALVNAPKELWHPCFVHIDEAHIFCPESSKSESMQSVIDICTRGRKRGFCSTLATQRLSKLHKDAAAECLNKMIGRTGLDIDRKRAGDELGMNKHSDMLQLRELHPGEFFTFGPAITNEVTKFKVSKVITTHLQSGKRITTSPPTPKAIQSILLKLKDIPEEAEKDLVTRQQLEAEVKRLKQQLSKGSTDTLKNEFLNEHKNIIKQRDYLISQLQGQINKAKAVINKISVLVSSSEDLFTPSPKPEAVNAPIRKTKTEKAITLFTPSENTNGNLPRGERQILTACAQYPEGLRRDQLTVITAYKRSSRDAYIQRLREKELLTQEVDRFVPTEKGRHILGDDFTPLPIGEDLRNHWLSVLPAGEKAILQILIEKYPAGVDRDNLSKWTGYQRSSRDAYIQRMAAKEIIFTEGRGLVKANPTLFQD